MSPTEIVTILNAAGHDGETDWALHPRGHLYYSKRQADSLDAFAPLSPASAEIIAGYYLEKGGAK